jgi:putative transposase
MRDMKRNISVQLREAIAKHPAESRREWLQWMMERAGKKNANNANFQLWRQDNHPIELDNLKKQHDSLDYIHNNPVDAGIVEKAENYLYSSARDYLNMQGKIEIIKIDAMIC